MPATAERIISSLPSGEQQAVLDEAKRQLAGQLETGSLARMLGIGAAVGGTGVGAMALMRILNRSMHPPKTTYTLPLDASVYRPVKPKKKRREIVEKLAVSPLLELLGGAKQAPGRALVANQPGGMVKLLAALGVGVPVGYMAGSKLLSSASSVGRHQELSEAQMEFDEALRRLAESQPPPKKTGKVVEKIAFAVGDHCKQGLAADTSELMDKLAANCTKLAGMLDAVPSGMREMALGYAVLAPLLGGYYGFKNRYSQRKSKALEYAEERANMDREKLNPTFSVAKLVDKEDPAEESTDPNEAQQEMEELLSRYDYL